jgi:hypothetical protein
VEPNGLWNEAFIIQNKNPKFLQRGRRSKASTRRNDDQRQAGIPQNLALPRNALLAITPFGAHVPLSSWFENCQRHQTKAVQLILYTAPVQWHLKPNALDLTLHSISSPTMNHFLELKATNRKSTPSQEGVG